MAQIPAPIAMNLAIGINPAIASAMAKIAKYVIAQTASPIKTDFTKPIVVFQKWYYVA